MEFKPGTLIETQFGPVQILRKVGNGGMGYVYRAKDMNSERLIAFKTTDSATNLTEQEIMRFEAEARTMQKLEHQNVVPFYNYGIYQDRLFISMKFIEGKSLETLIREQKQLGLQETVFFALQIGRGLKYIHEQGIIHRDLKPSNVMINKEGRIFLSDFGISQMSNSIRLTHTGMTMGTPEYMAPEQCQGLEITPRSDMYSLGIILYEMLTGNPPFCNDKPLTIAWKQVHEPIPLDLLTRSGVPQNLVDLIQSLLHKDPLQRPKDFHSFFDVFESLSKGSGPAKPIKIKTPKSLHLPAFKGLTRVVKNLSISSLVLSLLAILLSLWALQKSPVDVNYAVSSSEGDHSTSDLRLPHKFFIRSLKSGQDHLELLFQFEQPVLLLGFRYFRGPKDHPFPRQITIHSDLGSKRKVQLTDSEIQYLHLKEPLLGSSFNLSILAPEGARSLAIDRLIPIALPMGN